MKEGGISCGGGGGGIGGQHVHQHCSGYGTEGRGILGRLSAIWEISAVGCEAIIIIKEWPLSSAKRESDLQATVSTS